ncbi:MAG: DNA polymerase III subunit delta' [Azospirillaceae bacterium]
MSDAATASVTAPKPRATVELIGHLEPERAMLHAATSGRLPHAWLLGGPPGIGKATLAFRFARFVLSGRAEEGGGLFGEAPDSLFVPDDHPTARRIAARGHADLLTIERPPVKEDRDKDIDEDAKRRMRDIPVDEVRRIGPFLRMTAAEGGWRVVVVDEAERMNRAAANALLKLLEEPPNRALILLVAANPGRLLPTIRSRCRRLDLAPLAEAEVADWLAVHAPEMAAEDRSALARLSEGSPGRAAALAAVGGVEIYRRLIDLMADWPRIDRDRVHGLADRMVGGAAADSLWSAFGDLLEWWLSRLVRAAAAGRLPDGTEGEEGRLIDRLVREGSLDRWIEVWEKSRALLERADAAALDRRTTLITVFATIEAAGRS